MTFLQTLYQMIKFLLTVIVYAFAAVVSLWMLAILIILIVSAIGPCFGIYLDPCDNPKSVSLGYITHMGDSPTNTTFNYVFFGVDNGGLVFANPDNPEQSDSTMGHFSFEYVTYDPDRPPKVEQGHVSVYHLRMGKEIVMPADLVVLSTPLIAQEDAGDISTMLKVPLNENGFFLEGHVKLKPLDFATDGVYLCGNARFPSTIREAVAQGLGAASRAAGVLSKEALFTSGIVADISPETCCGCQGCLQVCPYGAINYVEEQSVCEVNKVLCKGCGGCAATCPSGSARLDGFSNEQIYAQIEEALAG